MCRCAMCGVKQANANRNNLYRHIGCNENLPHGKDKIQTRRRLRRSSKLTRIINAEREVY